MCISICVYKTYFYFIYIYIYEICFLVQFYLLHSTPCEHIILTSINLFIHHLLMILGNCYSLGSILGTWDTVVSKTKVPAQVGFTF